MSHILPLLDEDYNLIGAGWHSKCAPSVRNTDC